MITDDFPPRDDPASFGGLPKTYTLSGRLEAAASRGSSSPRNL